MSDQLSLFDFVEDAKNLSSTNVVEDAKRQAIQRYLDSGKQDPTVSISKYSPNGRKTEYYRLVYRDGKKVRGIHISGGNCKARLANYRVKTLQTMIDRGAELSEILEQLADFNAKTKP